MKEGGNWGNKRGIDVPSSALKPKVKSTGHNKYPRRKRPQFLLSKGIPSIQASRSCLDHEDNSTWKYLIKYFINPGIEMQLLTNHFLHLAYLYINT